MLGIVLREPFLLNGANAETGAHAKPLAKDAVFAKLVETQTHINDIIGYSG